MKLYEGAFHYVRYEGVKESCAKYEGVEEIYAKVDFIMRDTKVHK